MGPLPINLNFGHHGRARFRRARSVRSRQPLTERRHQCPGSCSHACCSGDGFAACISCSSYTGMSPIKCSLLKEMSQSCVLLGQAGSLFSPHRWDLLPVWLGGGSVCIRVATLVYGLVYIWRNVLASAFQVLAFQCFIS